MTSRSGTNSFHATVFYYFRNTQFDANDWFANAGGYARGTDRENRPGGVLGGPVVKNKTFFFVSFEDLQLVSPYTVIRRRSGLGDAGLRSREPASIPQCLSDSEQRFSQQRRGTISRGDLEPFAK